MIKRLHLKISGQVQGVLFRANAQEFAKVLGLTGFVSNLNDGTVEMIAEGEEENLKKFLAWANKGPELAKIEKIESKWAKPTGEFSSFEIK